ncbi:reverse transcriptase domain-containing protein [Tanacetum coccineum]
MIAPSSSSTNDANTTSSQVAAASPSVNTASPQVCTASVNDNTVYAFMVENPNGSNVLHQDLEQIHEDNLEAMDLKWQVSLLSVRAKKYYQKTGKKIFINGNDIAGYDKSKVECYNCHKLGHFAKECRAPRSKEDQFINQDNTRKGLDTVEAQLVTYRKNEVLFCEEVAVLKREVGCKNYEINVLKSELEKVKQEKDGIDFKIEKFDKASKDLDQLLGSQITDKSKKGLGYSAVPPPHPLIYNRPNKLDLSYSGLDEFKEPEFKGYGPENNNSYDNKGVSSKGPSITSIPKEGPSIARRSKEPIPKELLEWYGYNTVEDYLPVPKKPIPEVIFKSPIPIKGCVLGLANVETWDNIVKKFRMRTPERCANKSKRKRKKYSNDEDADGTNHANDADGTNHSDLKLVKRGITRLYKFRMEYGKPGGIKIKVTFDALNRVSGLHRALFLSFLGDLVREHIGLKILSWKKVDKESRDKLWDEITRYFDVDLTVRNLVMHRLGKLLRNFRMKLREKYILPNLNTPSKLNELPAKYSAIVKAEEWVEFVNYTTTDAYKEKSARGKMARSKNVYHHKMGRGGYVFVKEKMIENKEIEADEEPPRGIMWLKGRVNKDGEFTDDEIRSVGDKLKEADDKIKEGTLNLDDGTDAMTVVFGKEKGGYARGVGSGVTYKRYFHLPRSRQATDERIELLQTQLDNERRERQQKDELVKKLSTEMTQKDVLVNKLSNEMTETKGMLSQLMNQLAAQGVQLNLSSQLKVASNVTPMGAYEVDGTQSSVVVRDKDARVKEKSNGLVTSEKEPVKTVGPKKTPKSRRNGSQDSQLQGNASSKCKLWHLKKSNIVALGTVYKSAGKQILHNQALLNDCYKVSIDSSLVDAACIPDVGNNGLKTVKDGVTPPTTIQKIGDYNSAPKLLQSKHKSYVSRETMQRQARTGKSHKSLNYGS